MIRYLLALLVVLNAFTVSASSLTEANMDWLTQHHKQLEETLSSTDKQDFIPSLNTVLSLWVHRDGGITGEVSPYIIRAIITAPELVLGELETHPESYTRWLTQLQGQVFTAIYPEQLEQLNALKQKVSSVLSDYIQLPDSQAKKTAKRLLRELETITVYVVD
ncbi:hypothetical protein [Marinomonas fungiae]|uniref:hypothetical protein n=1 Tax=Marinomonas fungiae TaxID=1137284 RepID=UPI003A8F5DB8